MTLEMRLVHGDVLDATRGLIAVDINHLVHQQKRIAMWQDLLDQADIGTFEVRIGVSTHGSRSVGFIRCVS